MLSGIWDVLAARSHLYATPGVASPATRLPPRGVGSRFFLAVVVVVIVEWGSSRFDFRALSMFAFVNICLLRKLY